MGAPALAQLLPRSLFLRCRPLPPFCPVHPAGTLEGQFGPCFSPDVENPVAFDICSGFLFPALHGLGGGQRKTNPSLAAPSSPLPRKGQYQRPEEEGGRTQGPVLGCQTPHTWKQLMTWPRAVTSECPAHPGPLAGLAPGRKPPRSALLTTCNSGGDPERWLESKGSGSGRLTRALPVRGGLGSGGEALPRRWRPEQHRGCPARGSSCPSTSAASPDLPEGQEDASKGNGKHKLHTNLAFCCLELSFC